jgi:hypothetical protein
MPGEVRAWLEVDTASRSALSSPATAAAREEHDFVRFLDDASGEPFFHCFATHGAVWEPPTSWREPTAVEVHMFTRDQVHFRVGGGGGDRRGSALDSFLPLLHTDVLDLTKPLGLALDRNLVVTRVDPSIQTALTDLAVGARIRALNDVPIATAAEFKALLAELRGRGATTCDLTYEPDSDDGYREDQEGGQAAPGAAGRPTTATAEAAAAETAASASLAASSRAAQAELVRLQGEADRARTLLAEAQAGARAKTQAAAEARERAGQVRASAEERIGQSEEVRQQTLAAAAAAIADLAQLMATADIAEANLRGATDGNLGETPQRQSR